MKPEGSIRERGEGAESQKEEPRSSSRPRRRPHAHKKSDRAPRTPTSPSAPGLHGPPPHAPRTPITSRGRAITPVEPTTGLRRQALPRQPTRAHHAPPSTPNQQGQRADTPAPRAAERPIPSALPSPTSPRGTHTHTRHTRKQPPPSPSPTPPQQPPPCHHPPTTAPHAPSTRAPRHPPPAVHPSTHRTAQTEATRPP